MLEACRGYIEHLSRIADLHIGENIAPPKEAATAMVSGCEISIPYAGLIDIEAEKARLNKEISKAEAETESVRKNSPTKVLPPGLRRR